jgi:hypothetical protein
MIAAALVMSLPQLSRDASSRNYAIGAFAFASATIWLALFDDGPLRRGVALSAIILQTMLVALYFVPGGFGATRLPPPALELVSAYAHAVSTNAPPYYANDAGLALVWPMQGPAIEVTDQLVYPGYVGEATSRVETRVARCAYATLLLAPGPLVDLALHHGYQLEEPLDHGRMWLTRTQQCGEPTKPPGR